MDYNLDRKLRLKIAPEQKSLYTWSIGEYGDDGQQIGIDHIPWVWSQSFTATELVLSDSVNIKSNYKGEGVPNELEVAERHVIRAQLRPGETKYSMFGTNRIIEKFTLDIVPVATGQPERCWAWGSPEYLAEIDFYKQTQPDVVCFYMEVSQDKFDRYVRRIAEGTADELVLHVQSVRGFYSEWSPSIFTRDVKVLTPTTEQCVNMPEGVTFDPPRLGEIYEGEIYINAKRLQARKLPSAGDDGYIDEEEPTPLVRPEIENCAGAVGPQIANLLRSLQGSARWIIGLLIVVVLVLAFRGN